MLNWYVEVLRKYNVFAGRARRSEYWYFFLVNFIISLVMFMLDHLTGTYSETLGTGFFGGLYALAILVPGLAVTVRRLHDTGRSGWWILVGIVPLLGGLVLLYFTVQDSQPGDNVYGRNPKGMSV